MAEKLAAEMRKKLRGIGHQLEPVVMIGNDGLTDGVVTEAERALNDHELIKVKIMGEDREARKQVTEALATSLQAEVVQKIGKIILLYRKNPRPNAKLSNIERFKPS